MRYRHALTGILCLSSALVLAGCGQNAQATGSINAKTSDTAVVALAPETAPNWFFPVVSGSGYTSINFQINFMMYRPLVYITKTNQIDYQKSIAAKITENASDTVFTISLGHRYAWSNGQPVTAQDVVFTWDLIHAASQADSPWVYGDGGSGGVPKDWLSVVAVTPQTVVVTLAKPANPTWFIHNGLSQISPVPESVWNKHPGNMKKELQFIASEANSPLYAGYDIVDGAFRVASWSPNNDWVFVPNSSFGGHKASIQKLVLKYETSSSAEFTELKEGEVNVGYLPPSMWRARAQLTDDKISPSYVFGMNYISPNFNNDALGGAGPLLQKLYIRQAMQMGIDQAGMVSSLYHGYAVPTDGPIAPRPTTAFYDEALNTFPYHFNLAKGKALLESHGWKMDNGVMTKGGKSLTFTMLYAAGSTTETDVVQLIKQDWSEEGIELNLQSLPLNQLFGTMASPTKWALSYWNAGYAYQLDYYPTGGELFVGGAAENGGDYNSPTMNSLIADTYLPGTPSQISARLDAYQKYAATDLAALWMPWFPQGYARVPALNVHSDNIHGTVKYFNPVTNFMYANDWTISQ